MRLLSRFALATTTCFLAISILASVGFSQTPAELAASNAAAITLLRDADKDLGELLVPPDYFAESFEKKRDFPQLGGLPTKKLSLRDSPSLILAITYFAVPMLEIANDKDLNSEGYLNKWKLKKDSLVNNIGAPPKQPICPPDVAVVWDEFFDRWQEDVVKVDKERGRDAIRQAAYSMLRLGLNIEKEWIEKVKSQGNMLNAPAAFSGSSAAASGGNHQSHLYHRHEIRMWRITRPRR